MKQIIRTHLAPKAIGTYSQAVKSGDTVYISGQIPLDPETMTITSQDIADQVHQVFKNLSAIAQAAGGQLENIVKLTVYLTDMNDYATTNEVMSQYFNEPYPARVLIGISALPKNSKVEIDAIMVMSD